MSRSGPDRAPRPARTVSTRLAVVAVILGASGAALLWHSGRRGPRLGRRRDRRIDPICRAQPGARRQSASYSRGRSDTVDPARAPAPEPLSSGGGCSSIRPAPGWRLGSPGVSSSSIPRRRCEPPSSTRSFCRRTPLALGGPFRYDPFDPSSATLSARARCIRSVSPAGAGSDGSPDGRFRMLRKARPGADDDAVAFVPDRFRRVRGPGDASGLPAGGRRCAALCAFPGAPRPHRLHRGRGRTHRRGVLDDLARSQEVGRAGPAPTARP
jgi:hypothetical protein